MGSIPGSGRFSGGGNGNPLQHSCLENSMDRGAWWATVREVAQSQTRLSYWACTQARGGFSELAVCFWTTSGSRGFLLRTQWDTVCKGLCTTAVSYQDFLLPPSSLFGERISPHSACCGWKRFSLRGSPSFQQEHPVGKKQESSKNFLKSKP